MGWRKGQTFPKATAGLLSGILATIGRAFRLVWQDLSFREGGLSFVITCGTIV
jgi:hypothetical protein